MDWPVGVSVIVSLLTELGRPTVGGTIPEAGSIESTKYMHQV